MRDKWFNFQVVYQWPAVKPYNPRFCMVNVSPEARMIINSLSLWNGPDKGVVLINPQDNLAEMVECWEFSTMPVAEGAASGFAAMQTLIVATRQWRDKDYTGPGALRVGEEWQPK